MSIRVSYVKTGHTTEIVKRGRNQPCLFERLVRELDVFTDDIEINMGLSGRILKCCRLR